MLQKVYNAINQGENFKRVNDKCYNFEVQGGTMELEACIDIYFDISLKVSINNIEWHTALTNDINDIKIVIDKLAEKHFNERSANFNARKNEVSCLWDKL